MKALRSKTGVRRLHKQFRKEREPFGELCFMLQDWDDAYNVGGIFRVADGCGARELVMTGKTPMPPDPMISVTSLGSHRRIPFRHFSVHEEAALTLKAEGWSLIAVEIAEGAESYNEFAYPLRACLVLGSESRGLYDKVMRHCDAAVYVPMLNKGRSLNVHVAAAVVAFQMRLGGRR